MHKTLFKKNSIESDSYLRQKYNSPSFPQQDSKSRGTSKEIKGWNKYIEGLRNGRISIAAENENDEHSKICDEVWVGLDFLNIKKKLL